jgi:hypothetical protein
VKNSFQSSHFPRTIIIRINLDFMHLQRACGGPIFALFQTLPNEFQDVYESVARPHSFAIVIPAVWLEDKAFKGCPPSAHVGKSIFPRSSTTERSSA